MPTTVQADEYIHSWVRYVCKTGISFLQKPIFAAFHDNVYGGNHDANKNFDMLATSENYNPRFLF